MNVLSLFDGMSCGQIALERIGAKIGNYYASEIDEPAITVTKENYPNTIHLGSVTEVDSESLPKIDLLSGGSPCQDISLLNKLSLGLEGEKSSLFYQYLRLWKETNPKYFILENVFGNKEAIRAITKIMGVRPMRFNSNLVSAQNRKRLYWTNIPVTSIPKNKRLYLTDILEKGVDDKYFLKNGRLNWLTGDSGEKSLKKRFSGIDTKKAGCLTKRGDASWNCTYVTDNGRLRKLTPVEWERLQTVPDNYTAYVDEKFRYEMLGNGWTVDIVAHILKHIPGIV